ncbi:golgin subfamily A member 2-like [Perognathus longimembris pacificus]|uniref:golgin subfamily A member 2-like n=1 Tax=Perognathus longimembris pacificus TaxID=214514 RepID=UPI00201857A9|nr:golgin subfamily A member 2-like [Perognathus longimembris pacificus]
MSEKTREKKIASGKKLLQEYQQRNCPDRLAVSKRKKKTKKGDVPKTNTTGDCHSTEGVARDHTNSEPLDTMTAVTVQTVPGPNDTKDLERRYQHLMLALDSSRIRNQQLWSVIEQLKQERKELQDQQGKENEKMACIVEAQKIDLELHKLSIQMLVSENSDLQSALAHVQQLANEREAEHADRASRLQASQQRVEELERTLSAAFTMQNEAETSNLELTNALNNLKLQLQDKIGSYDNLEEENTKLQERLDVLLTQKADTEIKSPELQVLEERAELERQLDSMKALVATLTVERDTFAEDLRVERSRWDEKAQQLLAKNSQLTEEKEQGARQVLELESNVMALRKQLAEQQAQAFQLQKELKNLEEQHHIQIQETQSLRFQNLEQQERLRILEKKAEAWEQQAEDRRKSFETMEKERETVRCTLLHNEELKHQLAQLRDAFHRLSEDKEALASILHSEQQDKKKLQEKLDQLEKKSTEWKEIAEAKSQAAQNLQELHDQYLEQLRELRAACERHVASHQQLTYEKEALRQHLLKQTQLLEQLQQEQVQTKAEDQMGPQKLQDTLKCLEAQRQENEQLRAQLSGLALPREGEGISLREDKAQCQTKLEHQAIFPKSWSHGVSGDRKQHAHIPKIKLKLHFTHNLPDKVDYQSQVDGLHHQCDQLSKHISAIQESIVFYKEQMDVLDEMYQEKDQCVIQLSQEVSEKKKQLQELLLHLAGEGTEGQDKMPAAIHTLAAEGPSDLLGPTKLEVMEEQEQGFEDIPLEDSLAPAPGEPGVSCPMLKPTTEQIMPLLPVIQPHQEPAGLGNEPSFPFFSRLMQMMSLGQ